MSPKPFVPSNSQYDPKKHAYHPDCVCSACNATFQQRLAARNALHYTQYDAAKPGLGWSAWRWLFLLGVSLSIVAVFLGIILAGQALAREGNVQPVKAPQPIVIPAAHAKARAKCPTDKPLKCRAALIHAYEAVAWNRKQRLHARTLSSSALTPLEVGRELAARRSWGPDQFACLATLWNRESGWEPTKLNYAGSGAYGIPQALPAEKMRTAGADWRTNAATQIRWGLGYIKARYGTPCGALGHSDAHGYY